MRALLAVLVGWLPLLALTALQSSDGLASLREIGLHARYLVTVPLLIVAEGPPPVRPSPRVPACGQLCMLAP